MARIKIKLVNKGFTRNNPVSTKSFTKRIKIPDLAPKIKFQSLVQFSLFLGDFFYKIPSLFSVIFLEVDSLFWYFIFLSFHFKKPTSDKSQIDKRERVCYTWTARGISLSQQKVKS